MNEIKKYTAIILAGILLIIPVIKDVPIFEIVLNLIFSTILLGIFVYYEHIEIGVDKSNES